MEIQIIQTQHGGTEFLARPHWLHLGAQNAEAVDRLHFVLPPAWADCTAALYLRRSDGTQLAPVPLEEDGSVTVDRRLTGCTSGQWMLAASDGSGYTAYTRPGRYDTYATLPTDGGSEELPPTLYEQFVARVLESASTASTAAQKAAASAASSAAHAAEAQAAARQSSNSSTSAVSAAERAESAASRAEQLAPAGGKVLSVNGKGGIVQLTAQDLDALPCPAQPTAGALLRILSVDPNTGAILTDTTAMPDFSRFVRNDTVPTAQVCGPVKAASQYGVSVRTDGTLTTVPATPAQLDAMTDAFAPLVPAQLPYGVKKALTSASTAAAWSSNEQTAALRTLGVDLASYYTRSEIDTKLDRNAYTLPTATSSRLGGVKVGSNLTVGADGTLSVSKDNVTAALGFTPAKITASTTDLTAGSSALASGTVYLVYE